MNQALAHNNTYYYDTSHYSQNWNALKVYSEYNTETRKLHFFLEHHSPNTAAQREAMNYHYLAVVQINGKNHKRYLRYSDTHNSLFTSISESILSESRLKNSYNVSIKIYHRGEQDYRKTYKVYPRKVPLPKQIQSTVYHSHTQHHSSTHSHTQTQAIKTQTPAQKKSNAEIFAYRYIYKIEARHKSTNARMEELGKVRALLQNIQYVHNDPEYIGEIIKVINDKIIQYALSH